MPSKITAANIKSKHSYTVQEAAKAVNASLQTIRRWVNVQGMKIIEGTRPWLIEGSELKKFASGTRRPKMAKLGPGEMTCMKCRRRAKPTVAWQITSRMIPIVAASLRYAKPARAR